MEGNLSPRGNEFESLHFVLASLYFIFSNINSIFQQVSVKNQASSIPCYDLNSQPLKQARLLIK